MKNSNKIKVTNPLLGNEPIVANLDGEIQPVVKKEKSLTDAEATAIGTGLAGLFGAISSIWGTPKEKVIVSDNTQQSALIKDNSTTWLIAGGVIIGIIFIGAYFLRK